MKTLCFVLLAILIAPGLASACSCGRLGAKEALKYSDIAFRGELVAHKGDLAIFHVDEWWKGNPERDVQFEWRDGTHGDCDGFWPQLLQVGSKMVVFGRKGGFRIYHANICLPQKLVDEADDYLKELGPGKPPRHD